MLGGSTGFGINHASNNALHKQCPDVQNGWGVRMNDGILEADVMNAAGNSRMAVVAVWGCAAWLVVTRH